MSRPMRNARRARARQKRTIMPIYRIGPAHGDVADLLGLLLWRPGRPQAEATRR